jgi:hypothetical protein
MAGPQLPPGYRLATPQPQQAPRLPPGYRLAPAAPPAAQPRPSPTPAFGIGGPASIRLLDPNANGEAPEYANQPNEIPIPEQDPTGRALSLGVQGVGRGIANLAGAPFDMTNALANIPITGANQVFGDKIPYLRTDMADRIAEGATDLAEGAGIPVFDRGEMTDQERLGYDISNYGTQGAVAGASLAATGTRAAAEATPGVIGNVLRGLTRPYTTGPEAMAVDAAAGVGAGVGNYLHDEKLGGAGGALGDAAANIFGGVGGAGIGSLAQGLGRALMRMFRGAGGDPNIPTDIYTGNPFSAGEVDRAANRTQTFAREGIGMPFTQARRDAADVTAGHAARTIEEQANRFRGGGPESGVPTSGMISGNTGMVAAENRARVENPVPFTYHDQNVNAAARADVDSITPGADGRQFTDTVEMLQDSRVGAARGGLSAAEQRLQDARRLQADDALPVVAARGQRDDAAIDIDRAVVDEAMVPTLENSGRLYADVDPQRIAEVDAEPLVEAAQRVATTLGDFNDPAKVLPAGLLARIRQRVERDPDTGKPTGQITPTTVGDIVAVIPEIRATETRARRAGNYNLVDSLRTLRRSMEGVLESAAAGGDEAALRWQTARANYQQNVAPVFARGRGDPASELRDDFNQDRFNRSNTPPSATVHNFIRPAAPEMVASLNRVLDVTKNPEQARQAVRTYLLSDMARAGVVDPRTGVLNPRSLLQWRTRWGSTLDQLGISPEFDDLLTRAQSGEALTDGMAQEVVRARQQLTDAETNKGALGLALGANPVNAVESILTSRDPERAMRGILDEIGANPQAIEGLKASIRDFLLEKRTLAAPFRTRDGANPISFAGLDALFKEHESLLSMVYSPTEMNRLRLAHGRLSALSNRGQGATVGSPTAERLPRALTNGIEAMIRPIYGQLQTGGIMRTIRLWAEQLPSSEDAVQRLMTRMWFDPELATMLLSRDVRAGTPAWNSRLNQLLGAAEGVRESDQQQ